jgi:hypothetical protein
MHNYRRISQIHQSWKHGNQYRFLKPEGETDMVSRNVGSKKLPLLAA